MDFLHPSPRAAVFCILCAVLCFAGVPAARAQVKIGVVDLNKVCAAYYKTRDAEKKINEAREAAKKELDERMESHKTMLDEINQLHRKIDDPRLAAVRNPRAQVVEEVMRVVNEKARVEKYNLVLDKGIFNANGLPFLLASSPVTDFSDEVIAVLNKGH